MAHHHDGPEQGQYQHHNQHHPQARPGPGGAGRVDVQLQAADLLPAAQAELAGVRVGGQLALQPRADAPSETCLCSTSGEAVAVLPREAAWQVAGWGRVATVRSLKRDAASGELLSLQVRVQAGGSQQQQQQQDHGPLSSPQQAPGGGQQGAEDDDRYMLKREHYERLVADTGLHVTLKDEHLQALLTKIEGSSNREKELVQALANPDFRAFADKLIALMEPGEAKS